MNLNPRSQSPYVQALYGSVARGDGDPCSDVDLLIVGEHRAQLPLSSRMSVVRYTWAEFSEMASYGSLFLRHLRAEGRVLDSNDEGRSLFCELLASLPSYSRVSFDLDSFELAINDCELALIQGDTSVEFELASLATVMRHCAILGCYLMGCDNFTRTGAFDLCCDRLRLGADLKDDFHQLYAYRIALARDMPFGKSPSVADGLHSVSTARRILNGVREHAARTTVY